METRTLAPMRLHAPHVCQSRRSPRREGAHGAPLSHVLLLPPWRRSPVPGAATSPSARPASAADGGSAGAPPPGEASPPPGAEANVNLGDEKYQAVVMEIEVDGATYKVASLPPGASTEIRLLSLKAGARAATSVDEGQQGDREHGCGARVHLEEVEEGHRPLERGGRPGQGERPDAGSTWRSPGSCTATPKARRSSTSRRRSVPGTSPRRSYRPPAAPSTDRFQAQILPGGPDRAGSREHPRQGRSRRRGHQRRRRRRERPRPSWTASPWKSSARPSSLLQATTRPSTSCSSSTGR